ncbi:MAG: DsbA family protein [bacterium]
MYKNLKKIFLISAVILVTMISCTKSHQQKPTLNLYVMSHCPFGIRAENVILSFLSNFDNQLKLHVYYIVSKQGDHNFTSLHGPAELDEDLHQIAIQELYNDKFYSYLLCYNNTMNRDECLKDNKINKNEIDEFVKSGQAEKILNQDFSTTEKLGINASPTLYIDSKRYDGPIQPEHIIRAVCSSVPNLTYCKTLKPPVDVHVTLLVGGWDNIYHPNLIRESLDNFFYKANVDIINAGTQQGRALAEKYNLKEVPAIIFSNNITMTTTFDQIKTRLKKINDAFVDQLDDLGYRHLIDMPTKQNEMIMFIDVTDKASVNAGVSVLRLLKDYKKNQYHPVLKVISNDLGNDVLRTANVVEHLNGLPLDDQLNTLTKLYTDGSLKEFYEPFKNKIKYNGSYVKKEIMDNNAFASRIDTGNARFALLINNTELINPVNPSRAVGIFELSPIIGKMAFPGAGSAGKCAK